MFKKHGKKAEFVFVYLREVHPEGDEDGGRRGRGGRGGRSGRGGPTGPNGVGGRGAVPQPTTLEERRSNAEEALKGLGLSLTTVLDDMKDTTSNTWSSFPDRLFIVDKTGVVAFAGERGPRGFDAKVMETALEKLLKDGGVWKKPQD